MTGDDRDVVAAVPSSMGAKIITSAVVLYLDITDAITVRHREHPASFLVITKK